MASATLEGRVNIWGPKRRGKKKSKKKNQETRRGVTRDVHRPTDAWGAVAMVLSCAAESCGGVEKPGAGWPCNWEGRKTRNHRRESEGRDNDENGDKNKEKDVYI